VGFRLTRYGRREVIVATLVAAGLLAMVAYAAWRFSPWVALAAAAPVFAWVWVLWFFRDPDRPVPPGDGLFVSPADGRVADITRVGPEGPLGREGVQIGIFMNVFDVHVNRAPCDARVEKIVRVSGAFLDARDPAAAQRNESATITMTHTRDGRDYPVVVRQIAGLIARRIVTRLCPRQSVRRGERIGMIKFGSRVELLVPTAVADEVRVAVGRRVRAGQTVLLAAEKTDTP